MALTKCKGSVWESADNNLAINVKDAPYNAKGDGTTDDTAAIQAAYAAAKTSGDNVRIPSGTYLLSEDIFWDSSLVSIID